MNNTTVRIYRGFLRSSYKPILTDEVTMYIYVVTLIVGTIGNSLVLFSLLSKRRRKRMSANDVFILNLTVADLMLLLIFIPYTLYIRLAAFHPTAFVCKFTAPLITIALGGMVYTLTAMAVHRCLVITRPFRQECSIRRAAIVVAFIWLASISLSIPKISVATPYTSPFGVTRCRSLWKTLSRKRSYTASLFVLRFAIPFSIIIISYVKIAVALLKTQAPRFATDSSGNIRNVTNRRENMEVIKTLFVISFLFFILMLPFRVTLVMMIFGNTDALLRDIYRLTATLTIAHSCVNPIIYGAFMRKFYNDYKRFFIHLFCCRFCRKNGEEQADTLELDEGGMTSDYQWRKTIQTDDIMVNTTTERQLLFDK